MLTLITREYKKTPAGAFDSIEDAVKVACSALRYLEGQFIEEEPELNFKKGEEDA